nr:PH domain-containing protein [Altericroceibacterium endophyticum]
MRQAILPIVAAFFGSRAFVDRGPALVVGAAVVIIAFNVGTAWLGWIRREYFVGAEDIRLESGIFSREARSVPFERIQDVSLEEKFLPRLLGLATVRFETGAGGKDEMALSYVTLQEGARLRELVRARRDEGALPNADPEGDPTGNMAQSADAVERPAAQDRLLFSMGPLRLLTLGVFEFSLIAFALLFGLAQQLEFMLPFDLWEPDNWRGLAENQQEMLSGWGPFAQVLLVALALGSLSLAGFATGIIRIFARDWGFRLDRTAKGFRRRRGLLTRTDVVMPIHRVQAVQIRTGMIRRLFGWYSLRFVSLAQDTRSASHDVAPLARLAELDPIIREAGQTPPSDALKWHFPSPKHWIMRGSLLMVPILALAIGAWLEFDLWLGAAIGLIGSGLNLIGNAIAWRRTRWACDDRQIYLREGLLTPELSIAARIKLQSAEITQGPFGRMLNYADLHFGLAGGKMSIHGIDRRSAMALRGAVMESAAKVGFSDLPH